MTPVSGVAGSNGLVGDEAEAVGPAQPVDADVRIHTRVEQSVDVGGALLLLVQGGRDDEVVPPFRNAWRNRSTPGGTTACGADVPRREWARRPARLLA